MNIQNIITNTDKYYITSEGDVVCSYDNVTSSINFSIDDDICKSIAVTKELVYDVVVMKNNSFVNKYKELLKVKSPLTCSDLFRRMREFIIDNEVPISEKSKIKKTPPVIKSSIDTSKPRQEQVEVLLTEGNFTPKEISEKLNMNISYVRTILKKIKDATNS